MCLAEGKNKGVTANRDITGPGSGEGVSEKWSVRVSSEKSGDP